VLEYYDRRAPEYDEWYLGEGQYARRERPGWHDEVSAIERLLETLTPPRVLDVACGTGFLTRHFRGRVVGLDHSEAMLAVARPRVARGAFVRADACRLPFAAGAFDAVFTAHFYGHLPEQERVRFLAEARRVAPLLIVVDSALREGVPGEEMQQRKLRDGSQYVIYKRYFSPERLMAELGGGSTLYAGRWFVAVAV
jgi:SAM-dependent methyltransferase